MGFWAIVIPKALKTDLYFPRQKAGNVNLGIDLDTGAFGVQRSTYRR